MVECMSLSDEIADALSEGVGSLTAMGWKPASQWPEPIVYQKGDKRLFKKGTSWYLNDQKLGRLSDKALLAKLKTMRA